MTVRGAVSQIVEAVKELYPPHEATAIAREVVSRMAGYDFSALVLHYDDTFVAENFADVVAQLSEGTPVQYVVGLCQFCDMDFVVRKGVLIPRPETEELVAKVISDSQSTDRVLDVGTGSGAIAISVAKGVADAEVVAVDISDQALAVAAENSKRLGAAVTFAKADALADMSHLGTFDAIVSNPPYIPQSDMAAMHTNVVNFEPHLALFVADNDPLIFYRSIAQNGLTMLKQGGRLYFEIYEQYGQQIVSMLEAIGYRDVVVAEDIFSKPRMIWCRR